MQANDKPHRSILQSIAHQAMLDRGLLTDFSAAALAELARLQSPSAIVTKLLATLFVVYPFGLITPISWRSVGIIWAYCIIWLFMGDLAKLAVYRHMDMASPRHRSFLQFVKRRLDPYT